MFNLLRSFWAGPLSCYGWSSRDISDPETATGETRHGVDDTNVSLHGCAMWSSLYQDGLSLLPRAKRGSHYLPDCLHVQFWCGKWASTVCLPGRTFPQRIQGPGRAQCFLFKHFSFYRHQDIPRPSGQSLTTRHILAVLCRLPLLQHLLLLLYA